MKITKILYLLIFTIATQLTYSATNKYHITPEPVQVTLKTGFFVLNKNVSIVASSKTKNEKFLLQKQLEASTGFKFRKNSKRKIILDIDTSLMKINPEAYRLIVRPNEIKVTGATASAVFYGTQTLLQLFPSKIYSSKTVKGIKWIAPSIEIEDYPRFKWRGMHLDVARHFMPISFIKRFIDQLATVKMNTLHLHLTEDQGWRIEIKKYPKLTTLGSMRKETIIHPDNRKPGGPIYDGKPHGGFYSQKELKDLVAYAAKRHVNIMPEIELPGHSQAALTAYPEFGCTGDKLELKCEPGVSPHLYNVNDKTFGFLEDILAEVFEIFPSHYIHIGGDEAPKGQWKASKEVQAKMKSLGIKTEDGLQSWFINRIGKFIKKNGRQLVGWQEIMHGGTPDDAIVMPWMGIQSGFKAANAGHDVIIATTYPNYFDSKQSTDPTEPIALMNGPFTLKRVYDQRFSYSQIKPENQKHIIGAQGQLWTEYMPTPEVVEYQAFPRVIALAEAVWSPLSKKNYPDFLERLKFQGERMTEQNINFRFLDPTSSFSWNSSNVKNMSFEFVPTNQTRDIFVEIKQNNNKGSMAIHKVELFLNKKLIAKDKHYGTTTKGGLRNLYQLKAKTLKNGQKYTIRISGEITDNAQGVVLVTHGRNSWKYKPEKLKHSTRPIGSWDKISSHGKSKLTFDITSSLKKDGPHVIKFKQTDGPDALYIKGIILTQNGKTVDENKKNSIISATSGRNGYTLMVKNHTKNHKIHLILNKPIKDSNGYLFINALNRLEVINNRILWKQENLSLSFREAETNLKNIINKPGKYTFTFNYRRGGNGMDIESVSLIQNDKVIVQDIHSGFAGGRAKNNIYILEVQKMDFTQPVTLVVKIKGAGGINSFGDISIDKVKK